MRARILTFAIVLALVLPAAVNNDMAQRRMSSAEILAAVKPGQWVEVEGVSQRDRSIMCTEIKMLTGDFLDDDWSLSGIVERVNKSTGEMSVLGVTIRIDEDAEFENDEGTFNSFDDVKTGMFIEIEGTFLKDGSFLAKEVEEEEPDDAEESGAGVEIEAQGKVEKVDPARQTVQVMGITFRLTSRTKGKSAIK